MEEYDMAIVYVNHKGISMQPGLRKKIGVTCGAFRSVNMTQRFLNRKA